MKKVDKNIYGNKIDDQLGFNVVRSLNKYILAIYPNTALTQTTNSFFDEQCLP